MSQSYIPPFFFPTTVYFIDDNIDFLANLSLRLDCELAFQLFDSPEKALTVLNGNTNLTTPIERLFSRYHHTGDLPSNHYVIDVNLKNIHLETSNSLRFKQVSVAVVDYDMPSIDGLDFCRRIKNQNIKKILLTGKADEKIAIKAFNEGLIDRFIVKQDKDVITILNFAIFELQRDYFMQTERMLADILSIGKHAFLRDKLFAEKFREICDQLQIVEYYLHTDPDGFLMFDAEGTSTLLIIQNEEMLQAQYEIAIDQDAPQELLDMLKSKQWLPHFWQTGGHYLSECLEWRKYVFPSTVIMGKERYYYTIMNNPKTYKANIVIPYREYINNLDQLKCSGDGTA